MMKNKTASYVLLLWCLLSIPLAVTSQDIPYYSTIKAAFDRGDHKEVIELYKGYSTDANRKVSGQEGFQILLYVAQSLCLENKPRNGKKIYDFVLKAYEKGLSERQKKDIGSYAENCGSGRDALANNTLLALFRDVAIADASISIGRASGKNPDFILYGADWETRIPKNSTATRATATKPVRVFSLEEEEEAMAYAKEIHRGSDAVFSGSRYFVATSYFPIPEERLGVLLKELDAFYEILLAEYGLLPLPNKINITIAGNREQMDELGKAMYGFTEMGYTMGISMMDTYSMLCMIPKDPYRYRGTLRHELTHLLLNYTYPSLPPWLAEGLPALYEATDASQQKGIPNWRGQVVSAVMSWESIFNFDEFLMADWDTFVGKTENEDTIVINNMRQSIHYAMARYYVLYLQESGQLPELFKKAVLPVNLLEETETGGQEALARQIGNDPNLGWENFRKWLKQRVDPVTESEINKQVQQRLKALDLYRGSIDGDLGPASKRALEAFQRAENLTVTGEIDQATLVLLGIIRDGGNAQ